MTAQGKPLDPDTIEAIVAEFDRPDQWGPCKWAANKIRHFVAQVSEQQPEPATPTAGAVRAEKAIWDAMRAHEVGYAAMIDRETGLPELVAAARAVVNNNVKTENIDRLRDALAKHDGV